MKPVWLRAAKFSGLAPNQPQIELMGRYREWLVTEAHQAGGIGPSEIERVDERHLADSVLFASQIPRDATEIWDLGSGVGLPGIPLAICLPRCRFTLIDRSRRRTDLMLRARRILSLENCDVLQGDINHQVGSPDVIVSRATLPPSELGRVAERSLRPDGVAITGGSWRERPEHAGWTTVEIPPFVLDRTVWLLMMRRE